MAAAAVIVEPDRRGTIAGQLEVQVGGPTEEVTEEAPIAIDLVETGIRLHADGRAGRDQDALTSELLARVRTAH